MADSTTPTLVEAMARAIGETETSVKETSRHGTQVRKLVVSDLLTKSLAFGPFSFLLAEQVQVAIARACLTAIEQQGYVVVPKEPTSAMSDAASEAIGKDWVDGEFPDEEKIWSAMLSAAPKLGEG